MQANESTIHYIATHRHDDPRQLALKGGRQPDVDLPWALEQISAWQTARRKLPTWAAQEGLIYPPRLSMEQCSSESTARYKRLVIGEAAQGEGLSTLVDLTGGFGVDFSYMARGFARAIYCERQAVLCQAARHNFALLGLTMAAVEEGDSEAFLQQMPPAQWVYADPARRDSHGARTYGMADCTPNMLTLLPLLEAKASHLMVKLSPMIDWHEAVRQLGGASRVDIVAVEGEVKELLVTRSMAPLPMASEPAVYCVDLRLPSAEPEAAVSGGRFAIEGGATRYEQLGPQPADSGEGEADGRYLYEPNGAVMKAGCWDAVAQHFGLKAIAADSHLFVGNARVRPFPGRVFRVVGQSTMNKKELRGLLAGIDRANVAVRHFPMAAEALRKKLRLKDGGPVYLFGTTTDRGEHIILKCEKA